MKEKVIKVRSVHELHTIAGFEKPKHPLVSVIDYSKVKLADAPESASFVCSFYTINFKKNCHFMYGRQSFDHQEGSLHCTAPDQVITFDRKRDSGSSEGWGLYFHPELIRNSDLGKKIHEYSFFSYSENEALHLSDIEKQTLFNILKQIETEYNTNIDRYSNQLIISNIELLLNYCTRFYGRQFITRSNHNKDIISRFEEFLRVYFNSSGTDKAGLPSVKLCADTLNLSPNYLGDLLRSETGKNAQEHIHYHLLEKAKTLLAVTGSSISEISYELGFEYPQSFCKLFKQKTGISPTEYRNELSKN